MQIVKKAYWVLLTMSFFGTDPYLNFIIKAFEEKSKEFTNSDKIRDKSKIINECDKIGLTEYIDFIKNMSDDEFDEYTENRKNNILKLMKKNQKALFEGFQDQFSLEETSAFALSLEPEDQILDDVTEMLLEKLDESNYSRFFLTEFLSKMEMNQLKTSMMMNSLPLYKLTDILQRNFDSDENWAFATSILAIQESLVKKKLLELDMTEEELQDFLNNKAKHFPNLIDEVAKRIEKMENRKVSLTFFKSTGLRDMRNKMEHEGYKTKVCKEEIPDLLNEITKFENELFPKK